MFNFMRNGMYGIPQNLQTPVAIPQAVAAPHPSAPIGFHPSGPQGAVPTGPQGQHFATPQGNVFAQQRQQAIAASQAQEAQRQLNLANALRQRDEMQAQASNGAGSEGNGMMMAG